MADTDELSSKFNKKEKNTKAGNDDGPVSKAQIVHLLGQLSEPALVLEVQPGGMVVRAMRGAEDQEIADKVRQMQERLAARRHSPKAALNQAAKRKSIKR